MKHIFIILTLAFSINSFSQVDTININGNDFIFKVVKNLDSNDSETSFIYLYRLGRKGTPKYLLKHTLNCLMEDCNSMSVEMGDYAIKDSTLVFYSFWCWQGDAPVSPWGARIQAYKVKENRSVIMSSNKLYIETCRQGWHENKGIEYLFSGAKTKVEKEALKDYIRITEKEYNAKFVFGKEADKLLKDVKEIFRSRVEMLRKDWKKIDNSFGHKI